jgi:hypothetical protein
MLVKCALCRLQRKPKTLNAQQITRLTISPTIALFFILFSRFTPVDFANSLLKGIPHFLELGPKYFVSNNLFFHRRDHAQRTLPPILCHLFSLPDSHY